MLFEWDKAKAERNKQKHGVEFEEAVSVFDDPASRLFDDPQHSEMEERFIMMGYSGVGRLLVVSFTERTDATRIISARPATRGEDKTYGA